MTLALITLLPAELGDSGTPKRQLPDADRHDFCHRASSRDSLGEDLPSAQGQDAKKMMGKSLGPWLSGKVWCVINHTGHFNAAGFNAKGKN